MATGVPRIRLITARSHQRRVVNLLPLTCHRVQKMTTSHAADRSNSAPRSSTPALGWACACLLGLLMAGLLLSAALLISNGRNAEAAHNPLSDVTTVQTDSNAPEAQTLR
jgi:hypothetical protein